MNVNLSRDLYLFVKAAVQSGRYASASEVVRVALREKRDSALRDLRSKIEEGLESARNGNLLDGEALIGDLQELGKQRRATSKSR
jgi:putative addiction module CopG family antidote